MPASVLSLNFQYLELHWQLSYAVKVPHSMNLEKQTHRSVPRDNLSSHERSLLSTPIYQAEVTAAHVHNLRLCFWRDAKYPPVLPALDPDHGEVQLIVLEMSRNVQSGNTQNLKSMVIQRSFPKWSVAERRKTAAASDQAAVCACAHSRYFAGGSPSGLRV